MINALSLFTCALLVTAVLSQEGSCSVDSGIYKFNLTRWGGYVLNDGLLGELSAGFPPVPNFIVKRYASYYYGDVPLRGFQNVVVLKNQNDVVLFDTGSGPSAPVGGKLMPRLKAAGITPEDITKVFLTHAHPDHSAGLLTATGAAAFPNALVYLHVEEDKFWRMPVAEIKASNPLLPTSLIDQSAALFAAITLAYPHKIRVFNSLEDIGGVKALHVPGHTPGHTVYRINEEFVITGDVLTRTTGIQHPEWNIFSDTNRTQAVANRIELMESFEKEQVRTHLYHDFFPGIGYIVQDKAAFDFSALAAIVTQ